MKLRIKPLLILVLVFCMFILCGCKGDTELPRSFTVTFDTGENAVAINPVKVKEGYSIENIGNPTSNIETAIFRGWYSDSEFLNPWNMEEYRVNGDTTLYAKWSFPQAYPTEFAIGSDAYTKSMTWIQTGVTSAAEFKVEVIKGVEKPKMVYDEKLDQLVPQGTEISYEGEIATTVAGVFKVDEQKHEVTFTANASFDGGYYKVFVHTSGEVETKEFIDIQFKGIGTESDPYLVYNESDLKYLTTRNIPAGTFAKVMNNITIRSIYNEKVGTIFNGKFDGNGKTITIKNNSGLFYEIGELGEVFNVKMKGSISGSDPSIGVIANYNSGYIHDVESASVSVNSQGGKVNDIKTLALGGSGGIVGTNKATGRITACKVTGAQDNVIQGHIGVGCVAGINYGRIYNMEIEGIVGAYNGNEMSKTINNSFAGVVVGVNYGTVQKMNVDGKINCRRIEDGKEYDGATNIGGIVGYNATGALVEECFFHGMRAVGDTNVGGIAGYNDGTIRNCYTGRRVRRPSNTTDEERQFISPVTGSYNVGGIAGFCGENSVITNVFSTANVWAYGEPAYAISEKANNAVYCLYNQNYRTADRWLGQKYGVVHSNTLVAPVGENNLSIDNSARKNLLINHLLGWDVKEVVNEYTGEKAKENVKNEALVAQVLEVLGSSFKDDSTWGIVLKWNR